MSSKACKECGLTKELYEFYISRTNLDGRMGRCKACVKSRGRKNRGERAEQCARYERSRASLPHRVEACRKYQEEHKGQISQYKKIWTANNKERVDASKRSYYEREREEVLARSKKWAEDNPEKVRQAKTNNLRKRRAARHASRGNFTAEKFKKPCESYGNKCLACGDTKATLEADHVVPLTRGGSDEISNVQPLCGSCNRKKFVNIIDYRLNTNVLS